MRPCGTIERIWRTRCKGMAGETLDEVAVLEAGLEHDRDYRVASLERRAAGKKDRVTARGGEKWKNILGLTMYETDGHVHVHTSEHREYDVDDPELNQYLSELLGTPVEIVYAPGKNFDLEPVSLIGTQTVTQLENELNEEIEKGAGLNEARFRANLEISWVPDQPYLENTLIGSQIRVGEAILEPVKGRNKGEEIDGIGRCGVITYDPVSLEQDSGILTVVAHRHNNIAGVYARVVQPGTVRLDDIVFVAE